MTKILLALSIALTIMLVAVYPQSTRREEQMRESPKDIREIFLTFPLPAGSSDKDSFIANNVGKFLSSFGEREKLLAKMGPVTDDNVLDTQNGYLKISVKE